MSGSRRLPFTKTFSQYARLHDDDHDDHNTDRTPIVAQFYPHSTETTEAIAKGNVGGGFGPYAHHLKVPERNSTTPYSAFASSTTINVLPRAPKTTAILEGRYDDADDDYGAPHKRLWVPVSGWGTINVIILLALTLGLITLFAGYPIFSYFHNPNPNESAELFSLINGTGQLPHLPGVPGLIDGETPLEARTRAGFDGSLYELVFSDEFNTPGRTFYPGDDPFWEAVDLHYWPTGDLEWYEPSAAITQNGSLVITLSAVSNHDLDYRSAMLQSWNKLCFTGGYIEVRASLPGAPGVSGFWPAAWLMGNLGRAGYGGTTDGMWPYSYDACDVGTLENQTAPGGTPLEAPDGSGPLSYLPGQRVSACTCKGQDTPGGTTARGAPELDLFEATAASIASQSLQLAPFNADYRFTNTTPAVALYNQTQLNPYTGDMYQQAVSALAPFSNTVYEGAAYATFGVEYVPSDNGYITWAIDEEPTWTVGTAALAGDEVSGISSRLIPREPMSIVLNLGLSPSFQPIDPDIGSYLPAHLLIDYVRVYQRQGQTSVTCEPSDYPTQDYITRHEDVYDNPNITTWEGAGYDWPENRLVDQC